MALGTSVNINAPISKLIKREITVPAASNELCIKSLLLHQLNYTTISTILYKNNFIRFTRTLFNYIIYHIHPYC